jgi:hypothetical protein
MAGRLGVKEAANEGRKIVNTTNKWTYVEHEHFKNILDNDALRFYDLLTMTYGGHDEDGVLALTIPKKEEAKPKQIKVNVEAPAMAAAAGR